MEGTAAGEVTAILQSDLFLFVTTLSGLALLAFAILRDYR